MNALQECLGSIVDSPAKTRELLELTQVDPNKPGKLTIVVKYKNLTSSEVLGILEDIVVKTCHGYTCGTIMDGEKEVARFQAKQVQP